MLKWQIPFSRRDNAASARAESQQPEAQGTLLAFCDCVAFEIPNYDERLFITGLSDAWHLYRWHLYRSRRLVSLPSASCRPEAQLAATERSNRPGPSARFAGNSVDLSSPSDPVSAEARLDGYNGAPHNATLLPLFCSPKASKNGEGVRERSFRVAE